MNARYVRMRSALLIQVGRLELGNGTCYPYAIGAYIIPRMWTATDIKIVVVDDGTEGTVATAKITTPEGALVIMFERPEIRDGCLILHECHMHGEDLGLKSFGHAKLYWLARAVMELLDVEQIQVEGAVRTSGRNPGHRPRPVRFTRKIRADP